MITYGRGDKMYKAGDMIVYGGTGVCRVVDITVPEFAKKTNGREYYELEAVNNGWTACNHYLLKYLSNLSIPSLMFSIEVAYENRIKPSPLLPKSIPGVMAILALVNASRQNW